jgi:glycosyltransferase involved in cell wall biosynthesis
MSPLVSVIIPLFNSDGFMQRAVFSALNQSLKNIEIILIDDCSTDGALSTARKLADQDPRIKVIALTENGGGGAARNAGIAKASGKFIAFLDADDLWEANKLETQISQMDDRGALLSYTDYSVLTEGGEVVRTVSTPDKVSYQNLLKDNVIGCSTVVYNCDALGKRYFPLIRKRQDFALWLSVLRDVDYAHRCGPELTHYQLRKGSVSANKLVAAVYTWRVYREVERLPFWEACYYFAHYAFLAVRKRM